MEFSASPVSFKQSDTTLRRCALRQSSINRKRPGPPETTPKILLWRLSPPGGAGVEAPLPAGWHAPDPGRARPTQTTHTPEPALVPGLYPDSPAWLSFAFLSLS